MHSDSVIKADGLQHARFQTPGQLKYSRICEKRCCAKQVDP